MRDYAKYSARHRTNSNNYRRRQRVAAITLLGGICKKCGFDDIRALQIDHVNGGGKKEILQKGGVVYLNLVIRSILAGETKYQLLCANCNWIKRWENNESKGRPIKTI